MNTKIIGIIVLVAVVAGGAFYGGMTYTQQSSRGPNGGDFANLSPEDRQARFGANGVPTGGRGPGGMNGGFTAGEIISKEETGVTIKMQDGSTKIVLVGSNTQIIKSMTGTNEDLAVGAQVTVTGSTNNDGSLTAESVQIRPAGIAPFGSQDQTNQ